MDDRPIRIGMTTDVVYREEIDEWARRRMARLRSMDGWLSLAGRWELSDEATDLPIGTARLEGDAVVFRAAEGAGVTLPDGTPVGDARLRPDRDKLLEGRRVWEIVRTGGGVVMRVRDPDHPALTGTPDIPRYPVDARWRIVARVVPEAEAASLTYASGATVERKSPGRLEFDVDGARVSLSCAWEGKDRLFVLFGDATNGSETYGAGRFLYAAYTGGDTVELDFNRAFNPPCALTGFAVCPLVPPENRMPFRVDAGEKNPA